MEPNTDQRFQLALHGLLHDIGKFWQRAEATKDEPIPASYGGFDKANYGAHGAHATWSAAFINQFIPPTLRGDASTVLFHHNPYQYHADAQRIALADRLAAGERADPPSNSTTYVPQLLSVFSQLNTGTDAKKHEAYFDLVPLTLSKAALFPQVIESIADSKHVQSFNDDKARRQKYQALWKLFTKDAENLMDIQDLPTLVTSLYHLLEYYTWAIPAAYYRNVPDISLFDHSRVTGAVAACLADIPDDEIQRFLSANDSPDKEKKIAYLLEGDISGVQRFIYTITARGATSALRGRSFYLQMLTEAIARYILQQLSLPITNLIYVGGGNFYLLIPAAEYDKLSQIQTTLDSILLAHHQGELYVAIGATPLTCSDFQAEHFANKWREASQAVNQAKRQRFSRLSGKLLETFFSPQGHGGNEEQECQVCHYEGPDVKVHHEDKERNIRKCGLCYSLEILGKDLRFAEAILLVETQPILNQQRSNWQAVLSALGIGIAINSAEKRWATHLNQNATNVRGVCLGMREFPAPNEQHILEHELNIPIARGLRFMVNTTPVKPNHEIADFGEIQDASTGIKRLGFLRMDVDSLGNLFAEGFKYKEQANKAKANHATLARVASLSASLSRYFEGYVGLLCQQMNDNKGPVVYTIYSGGDDLFIVGAWNYLIELAQQIRTEFGEYSLGKATLSGGISLHGGKEPLYLGAETAHDALEAAKYIEPPNTKDALSFLGESLKWNVIHDVIVPTATKLADLIESQKANRSLLQILMTLYQDQRKTKKRHLEKGIKEEIALFDAYMWRGIYRLFRMKERSDKAKQEIEDLLNQLQNQEFRNLRLMAIAARWAELLTRQEKTSFEHSRQGDQ